MRLTNRELALAKTALRYQAEGTPMKDAFDTNYDEIDLTVKCMKIAVAAQRSK